MKVTFENTYNLFFHPLRDKQKSKVNRGLKLLASVAIGIATLSICHIVVASLHHRRLKIVHQIDPNKPVTRTNSLIPQILNKNVEPNLPPSHSFNPVQTPQIEISAELLDVRNPAATKIQKVWRGHQGRLQAARLVRSNLHERLTEIGKPFITNPEVMETMNRAKTGKTRVYYPKDLPIIIKASGQSKGLERLKRMLYAEGLCKNNHYRRLLIPSAKICGEFLIESRLPIQDHDYPLQVGLYIENRDRFTRAAKEFTGFLCQSRLRDLDWELYSKISGGHTPRWDNVVLYIENCEGKVGLVDLEDYSPNKPQNIFFECETAVLFFPLHVDEIIASAKRFDPDIVDRRDELKKKAESILKIHKLLYWDHMKFLKEKGISVDNPKSLISPSPARRREIMEKMLKSSSFDPVVDMEKTFLNPEQTVSDVIDLTIQMLSELLVRRQKNRAISSIPELLSARTLNFSPNSSSFNKAIEEILKIANPHLKTEAKDDEVEYFIPDDFAKDVIDFLLEEFSIGGELNYVSPNFNVPGQYFIQC